MSKRVILKVNVMIGCQEILSALKKSVSSSIHFNVVYSGIGFSSSCNRKLFKKLDCFGDLHLDEFFINLGLLELGPASNFPGLNTNGILWLDIESSLLVNCHKFKHLLLRYTGPIKLVVTGLNVDCLAALHALKTQVSSLSVLSCSPKFIEINSILGQFLDANSKTLEFLQLKYVLTLLPPNLLQKFANLRVLSVSVNTSSRWSHHTNQAVTASQIFTALEHLYYLEYFEWSEPLNIITRDILALYNLLSNFLPKLVHWHWKLSNFLLFTTDLKNSTFEPLEEILKVILAGKTASSWCTTYKFAWDNLHLKKWLETIRPLVCFCFNPTNCTFVVL